LASDPPFQQKQDPTIREAHLLRDLRNASVAVIAGSIMNWGAELEDTLSLIVFLTLAAEIRVTRVREREMRRFGRADAAFIAWVAQYDEGKLGGRSLQRHGRWLSNRSCTILRIDGDSSTEDRVARVCAQLSAFME
jgi:hypothetical protein